MDLKGKFSAFVNAGLVTAWFSLLPPAQGQAVQDESVAETNSIPSMKTDVRRDVPGTYMPYRYAFVTVGQEKYTFLVPEGYRVDNSDSAKLKLASPDFSSLIIVGMAANAPTGVNRDGESLQAHVLTIHPDATIKSVQTICANSQSAPAVDYIWKTDSGIKRVSRTSYISTTSGLMEFTLTSSSEQFDAGLNQLNLITLTFRTGSDGKFDYVIGSKYP